MHHCFSSYTSACKSRTRRLIDLKDSVSQYRNLPSGDNKRQKLELLIKDQAKLVNFKDFEGIDELRFKILESENAYSRRMYAGKYPRTR